MSKILKFSIAVFTVVVSSLIFASQAQAANVQFTADTQLDFTSVPATVYVKSGSACDSLNVSTSTLNADVPAGSTFTLKTAGYTVLELTPSGGTVTLAFDTIYFSSGYLSQWTASSTVSSASVGFSVRVAETNADYLVKVDGSNLGYYTSDGSGIVSFTYTGGFSSKTFTITRENRPVPQTGGGSGITSDVTPPAISQIAVTTGDTSATISWQTNESSISWLLYGTTTNYGIEKKTTTYLTSHSITLTDLSPQTTYHYQLKSKDSSGNVGSYTDQTFITLALGEKPKVEEVLPVTAKPISEMTVVELKTEIARILTLISQLQTQLGIKVPAKIEGIPAGFTFSKNLSSGMTDPDVVHLKTILVNEGCLTGVKNTKYFASKTKEGVKCLCQKYQKEISQFAGYEVQCSGFVGKGIIAKLNQLIK